MTDPDSQTIVSAPASMAQALPSMPSGTASSWPVFWVASVAVFLVSMDRTMLFAAFSALRAGFPQATAQTFRGCSMPTPWSMPRY